MNKQDCIRKQIIHGCIFGHLNTYILQIKVPESQNKITEPLFYFKIIRIVLGMVVTNLLDWNNTPAHSYPCQVCFWLEHLSKILVLARCLVNKIFYLWTLQCTGAFLHSVVRKLTQPLASSTGPFVYSQVSQWPSNIIHHCALRAALLVLCWDPAILSYASAFSARELCAIAELAACLRSFL